MRFLIFGQSGQVASELARLPIKARFVPRAEADHLNPAGLADIIRDADVDAVINAVAWTNVDGAETEWDAANCVNGDAPAIIAKACATKGIPFVHISTDYVFDGAGDAPFSPTDKPAPLGAYGRSKLNGESGVQAAGGTFAILRTSWVFSAHGNNFVKTMLRLSETRDALNVVADQIGGPTPARAIAQAVVKISKKLATDPSSAGIYHFSGNPDLSWADFARAIFECAGRPVDVTDIPTIDYPTPAKRPLNSRMDCSQTNKTFGIDRPDWRHDLELVIKEVLKTK